MKQNAIDGEIYTPVKKIVKKLTPTRIETKPIAWKGGKTIVTTHEKNKVSKPTVQFRNSFGGLPDDDSALSHLRYQGKNIPGITPYKNAVSKRLLTSQIKDKEDFPIRNNPSNPKYITTWSEKKVKPIPSNGLKATVKPLDTTKTLRAPKNFNPTETLNKLPTATNNLKEIQKIMKDKYKNKWT